MASPRLKKKLQPYVQGAVMRSDASGSSGPHGGVLGLSSSESLPRDGRKRRKDKLSRAELTLSPYYFDGHLWRKYGNKRIKDALFPRLYFRCSYHDDRGCMASKVVQQLNSDDPPLFEVTYMDEHTCNAAPVPPPDVVAAAEPLAESGGLVLSFGSSHGCHRTDARLQLQERRHHHQWQFASPPSPFSMMNFDSSSGQLDQQLAFFRPDVPLAALSWPAPTSTSSDEGGVFAAWEWDAFKALEDDQLHFGDHAQSHGSSFSCETDECSLAHLASEMEAELTFQSDSYQLSIEP